MDIIIIPRTMEITMPNQHCRQRLYGPMPECPEVTLQCLRAIRLRMIVECTIVLTLILSAMAMPSFAQSPSSLESSTSSTSLDPDAQAEQQTSAATVIPSATTAPPEYRVGIGDILGVTVYNMPELNRTGVVGSEGTFLLSYLPQPVTATGKTGREIGQEVSMELKQLQVLLDPQVSVSILRVESKPVVVGGDVRNPQVLQEVRALTLLQVLMLAGGPGDSAGDSVLVTRTNSNGNAIAYDLPLAKVLSGTDSATNIGIQPGDTVQVLPDQKVFVAGAVKKPGAFPLGRGQRLTVSKLMALTGGWEASSKPGEAVIVRQGINGQRETVPLDLPKIMALKEHDVALGANDLLYVPGSTAKTVGLTIIKGVGGAAMLGAGYLIVRH